LVGSDVKDIKKTCQGYFGEKSWTEKSDDIKVKILDTVKDQYFTFLKIQNELTEKSIADRHF
jgi:hypothetical protein